MDKQNKLLLEQDLRFADNLLREVLEKLPGHIYWKDVKGMFLGCNTAQAIDLGLNSTNEIVGKYDVDLFGEMMAEQIYAVDKNVIDCKKSFIGEEQALYPDGYHTFLSSKTPLKDKNGEVIGLLGISIDVTERKIAEQLSVLNGIQEAELKTTNDFCHFIHKAAHDLASPLFVFDRTLAECTELNDKHAESLKKVAADVRNIMAMLRMKFQKEEERSYLTQQQDLLIHLQLQEVVENKRSEYQGRNIKFSYNYEDGLKYATIACDPLSISRSLSNIINNAVEALKNDTGEIGVTLSGNDKTVTITVSDNGIGMSDEMMKKIVGQMGIVTTKKQGSGIGLQQVYVTLRRYNGTLSISSKEGRGTDFSVHFPRTPLPDFMLTGLSIKKGSTVVVLDDSESILEEWMQVLSKFIPDINVKIFQKGRDALGFIDTFPEREKIFFLCDYFLDKQSKNGLTIVLESEIKRQSVLVSSFFNNKQLFEGIRESRIRFFPKQFMHTSEIKIVE